MAKARYTLSQEADADLQGLYEWGIEHFSEHAVDQYYDGLIARLTQIATDPQHWPAVDDIRTGYRRSVYGLHSIYYRAEAAGILIVRILGRQNPQTSLPSEDA